MAHCKSHNGRLRKLRLQAGEIKTLNSSLVRLQKCLTPFGVSEGFEVYNPLPRTAPKTTSVTKAHTKRRRHIWARKRSPHVFSKSQESFGFEKYNSVATFKVPCSYATRLIRGAVRHRLPGRARYWTRQA